MQKNRLTSQDLFLAFLALLLLSISFHQTWLGLEQLFGTTLSILFSFVLSAMLLFLNWKIRNAKLAQEPIGGFMSIYTFVAIACFTANFNALYTRFMKNDIYADELRTLNASLNKMETDVTNTFEYKYPKEIAQQVELKKNQLVAQIQDPGNLGIGDRAKNIIKDIERLLGQKVDLYNVLGTDYADLAKRMAAQIDGMILKLTSQEAELKVDISQSVLDYNAKIRNMLLSNNLVNEAQKLIDEIVLNYNKLGAKAQNIVGEDKYKFVPFESDTQKIGKIGYAFTHAFSKNFSIYSIVVLFACILLDFLVPIIILLVTKPSKTQNSGQGVWDNKRKGGIILPNS